MANHERRNSIALDDAFNYCRLLETKAERPVLYKLCNAIRTLDLALESHESSPIPMNLCMEAWSSVRDSLFNTLVSSVSGHFDIYDQDGNFVEPGGEWPDCGRVEFFPEQINRRNDSYDAKLERLSATVSTVLRWCYAENRQECHPVEFASEPAEDTVEDKPEGARELLERLYEVCQEQAAEGKKKAHRKWWQLYWEANSCPNKREKHELQKQMVALEGVWGRPEKVS